jgi:hypothetical protein
LVRTDQQAPAILLCAHPMTGARGPRRHTKALDALFRHARWLVPLALAGGLGWAGWAWNPSQRHLPQRIENGSIEIPWISTTGHSLARPIAIEMSLTRGVALEASGKPTRDAALGELGPHIDINDPSVTLEVSISVPVLPARPVWGVSAVLPAGGYVSREPHTDLSIHELKPVPIGGQKLVSIRVHDSPFATYEIASGRRAGKLKFWISWRHPSGLLEVNDGLIALAMPPVHVQDLTEALAGEVLLTQEQTRATHEEARVSREEALFEREQQAHLKREYGRNYVDNRPGTADPASIAPLDAHPT